ncbi:hypothetical protein DFH09DRAFT_1074012 [Mycena vulgaris]|nr:hypothetical protein DFH09DRAFT_1074012 [Mycena vulgaris]
MVRLTGIILPTSPSPLFPAPFILVRVPALIRADPLLALPLFPPRRFWIFTQRKAQIHSVAFAVSNAAGTSLETIQDEASRQFKTRQGTARIYSGIVFLRCDAPPSIPGILLLLWRASSWPPKSPTVLRLRLRPSRVDSSIPTNRGQARKYTPFILMYPRPRDPLKTQNHDPISRLGLGIGLRPGIETRSQDSTRVLKTLTQDAASSARHPASRSGARPPPGLARFGIVSRLEAAQDSAFDSAMRTQASALRRASLHATRRATPSLNSGWRTEGMGKGKGVLAWGARASTREHEAVSNAPRVRCASSAGASTDSAARDDAHPGSESADAAHAARGDAQGQQGTQTSNAAMPQRCTRRACAALVARLAAAAADWFPGLAGLLLLLVRVVVARDGEAVEGGGNGPGKGVGGTIVRPNTYSCLDGRSRARRPIERKEHRDQRTSSSLWLDRKQWTISITSNPGTSRIGTSFARRMRTRIHEVSGSKLGRPTLIPHALDWYAHKIGYPWHPSGFNESLSHFPKGFWAQSPSYTKLVESAHVATNKAANLSVTSPQTIGLSGLPHTPESPTSRKYWIY